MNLFSLYKFININENKVNSTKMLKDFYEIVFLVYTFQAF